MERQIRLHRLGMILLVIGLVSVAIGKLLFFVGRTEGFRAMFFAFVFWLTGGLILWTGTVLLIIRCAESRKKQL